MKLLKQSPALGPLGRLTLQEGTKRAQGGGSPEGTKRLQAGGGAKRNPCIKVTIIQAPKGRQRVLSPLRGSYITRPVSRGCTPACGLFRPSAFRVGDFNKESTLKSPEGTKRLQGGVKPLLENQIVTNEPRRVAREIGD